MLAGYHSGTIWALAAEYVNGAVGGGGVTHWLWMWRWGQCFTHTALKCLCTVFPLLSSIPPPPLSSSNKWSFCSSVFATVGWRTSAGPNPKTSGLSWNCFLLQFVGFFILLSWFFSYLVFFFIAVGMSLFLCLTTCPQSYKFCSLCPHLTSRLIDIWNSFPPFCSLHILLFNFFFFTKICFVFMPFVLLPFNIVFHSIL